MLTIGTIYGEVQYNENQIISFRQGLPGFNQLRDFVLIDIEEHAPFRCLQSLEDADLSFVVVSPFEFFPEYTFDLEDTTAEELSVRTDMALEILVIVSIRNSLATATANLVAPLVINKKQNIGKQVILSHSDYTTKHLLFDAAVKD